MFRNVKCYFVHLLTFDCSSSSLWIQPRNDLFHKAFPFHPQAIVSCCFPFTSHGRNLSSLSFSFECNFSYWGFLKLNLQRDKNGVKKTSQPDLVKYYLGYVVQCKQSVTSSWTAMILMLRKVVGKRCQRRFPRRPFWPGAVLCLSGSVPTSTIC